MDNRDRIYDDKDIFRERSDSYDSDTSRSGYATSQTSDNEYYDFDNELSNMDMDDENSEGILSNDITKKEEDNIKFGETVTTPEIFSQSSALAVEYNMDDTGKISIPYGIFMECKTISDGNIVCVKRGISTTQHSFDNREDEKIDIKINKKTRKNEKFNKTKKRVRRDNITRGSKKHNPKMKKGTKRNGVRRN
jgi:hypothetical protein